MRYVSRDLNMYKAYHKTLYGTCVCEMILLYKYKIAFYITLYSR